MTGNRPLQRFLRCSFLLACLLPAAAAYSVETVFSDSMKLDNDRRAGQTLDSSAMEEGSATWFVDGSVVFRKDGGVTSSAAGGGTACHPLPFAANIYRISAEISPASTSCTAISVGNKIPFGDYFHASAISFILNADGGYDVMVRGFGKIKSGTKADYPDFNAEGFTKLELEYNSTNNTVTAKINGKIIMDSQVLVSKKVGPFFTHASFRFNGPLEAGVPKLKNYSITLIHNLVPPPPE